MIDKIISFSIKNKVLVGIMTLALIGWGIYSMRQISVDAVPDITNNQVQVITVSRNLAAQEIEQFITYPVELSMANLPGLIEIRSVSKFGLSVVTVVFEDDMGTYLPRQLVAEKLNNVRKEIPEKLGDPFMAPITTGLGEIYQFTLNTKDGYDSAYSARDLRSIMDWTVKRQLSGIEGVVEVNTWGGFVKQYEASINPEKLNSHNISIREVYRALEKNNQNVGGSYIEKSNSTYFIRGIGLVKTLEDIRQTVVKNIEGNPVTIGDVARVKFGHSTRFGAVTANGKGEAVGGVVMMLKGGNSAKVIERIKERISKTQKSLPEGVVIEPFLDRTKLIDKTTYTVTKNLTEGGLIVILVLILFLGNIRAGLIVASIIPLSMLFTFGMMNLFDVSANLMSLGAIDFGIIVDGAVIIVEYIIYQMVSQSNKFSELSGSHRNTMIDKLTFESAGKMMRSAVFGQIIILIVFIPILTLTGVEGKMFRPMALTFGFAVLGAMLLCLTFVPMISSVALRKGVSEKRTLADRIMDFLQKGYDPVIRFALKHKAVILVSALALFAVAFFTFRNMGGVFIPKLDEGDYAIHPLMKTGTSLSKVSETTTKLQKIVLQFPEVEQAVAKIGSGEVPTDPMSMYMADLMIILKDKSEWETVETKQELEDTLRKAMSTIPGVNFAFSQPIEMRFNELMTGIRQDIAVKIYGDDLDVLAEQGKKAGEIIRNIEGTSDVQVEQVEGLPEMRITYKRNKLAQYGLNISDLNEVVSTAFAGGKAGVVYEGERRFDLVARLQKEFRKDIDNIRNLYVELDNGKRIPLKEVAEISYEKGPAQISRDNTYRRVAVGVNASGVDIETMVQNIRTELKEKLKLPDGYYLTYGGEFENLKKAKDRLMIVVPVALVLIFILLFFAFNSLKQALLIYTAIPLSAIGGVFSLWIRDLPFSISAGVGFIALFGVAVLNGIVLISYFNQLKKEGMDNIRERVLTGTKARLRPVLMTATVAALGFTPMALSISAGSEVQRPLATVVIGGLITAALLTLVVLPVLYSYFETKNKSGKPGIKPSMIILPILLLSLPAYSQEDKGITLEKAIETSLQKNPRVKANRLSVKQRKKLKKTSFDFGKTQLYYQSAENSGTSAPPGEEFYVIGQQFSFPTVYATQNRLNKEKVELSEEQMVYSENNLVKKVSNTYYDILFSRDILELYIELDSFYVKFSRAANLRFETGESSSLEKLNAKTKSQEVKLDMKQAKRNLYYNRREMQKWLNSDSSVSLQPGKLKKAKLSLTTDSAMVSDNPILQYFGKKIDLAHTKHRLEKSQLLPDIGGWYGWQRLNGQPGFYAYQIGVKIPLWFLPRQGKIQAASIEIDRSKELYKDKWLELRTKLDQLITQLQQYKDILDYYEDETLLLANDLIKKGQLSYEAGEISYLEYIQNIEQGISIKVKYKETLLKYNKTVTEINFLTGQR